MDKYTPRYKAEPSQEDLPKSLAKPDLKCCQIVDDKLILPKDVRATFLTCPMFGPEWRELLSTFDKQWSVPIGESNQNPSPLKRESPVKQESVSGSGTKTEVKQEGPDFNWANTFPDEPTTFEALKQKYGGDQITELAGHIPNMQLVLTPGPCLYVMAKDAICVTSDQPLIAHGPGTWLLGEKASKYMSNNPGKAFPCAWTDDIIPVIIEETSLRKQYVLRA